MRKVYKISLGLILALVCSFSSFAQQSFFSAINETTINLNGAKREIIPQKYSAANAKISDLKQFLWSLPSEKSVANKSNAPILEVPMPDGSMAKFNVWESSLMEPGLEAKLPEMKTFAGKGITDPYATIRFDYNPYFGFHAQILSPNGRVYIDPYVKWNVNNYISYYTRDNKKISSFICETKDNDIPPVSNFIEAGPCRGTELFTYRLALACTGEYAVAVCSPSAPTVAATAAAMLTTVNRVTGVYEKEVSLRMVLVANNNNLIYLDGATDPYTNNNGGTMLGQNQSNVDAVIGSANYDIGHVVSTGGGGVAFLRVPCVNGSKAGGVTGLSNPVGDNFDIDYVAHEMGHQWGGNHTFNSVTGSCSGNRNASTAYEVGSGTSIQAYAGICGTDDTQPHSDPFFHTVSFDEISNYISTGAGNTCKVATSTGNTLPQITSMSNNGANIPISTPFTLTGTATDTDGDPITYCWEQWDLGPSGAWNGGAASTTAPLFKSRIPKTSGSRTFPDINVILAGYPANPAATMGGLKGETLPTVARAMKFRLTVRDVHPGNPATGGVVTGGDGCQTGFTTIFQINTINTGAPFAVTVPNGGESYPAGSTQTITWNTVGTENAPINVANVKISLSTDGGLTYPTVITASTPNDGTEALTIPVVAATSTARVKIEAVGNIFFDISNANFNITAVSNGFDLGTPGPATAACPAPASMAITLTTSQIGTFTNPISFIATGNPGGTTVSFSPTTVTAGNSTTVTLNGTNTLAPGSYPITVTASATGAASVVRTLTYTITPSAGPAITAQPAAQTLCAGANTSFSITSATATAFQWQVSTDGGANYNTVNNGGVYSGATTATLSITGATATLNGYLYRCVASVVCGSTNSNAALLTVNTAPAITSQPSASTICATSNTSFSITATGSSLGYQWQVSTNGCAGPWTNIANAAPYSGVTTPTLSITGATAGMNNYGYQCVVTGACTPSVTSSCGLLTIVTSVTVTTQPNNSTVCENAATSFTAAGSGAGVIYQWQISTDGGTNYTNITNGGIYSGATSATLNISAVTFAMNNYRYRCSMTNATCSNPGISSAAVLTVNTLPVVTVSPTSQTICLNSNTSFTAAGTGTGLTYQWQVSTNGGGSWTNLTNTAPYSGVTTGTLAITAAPASINTYQYRCVLSGTCPPAVNSGVATITVINPVSITTQPANATVCATLNTSFAVVATSTQTITYQWQVSTDGGVTYNNVPNTGVYSGATTPTLSITGATNALNNNRYRVQLNNVTCSSASPSNAATLTVNALPIVTWPTTLVNQCANATTYALTGGLPAGGTYKGPGVTGTNFNASVAGIGTKTLWYIYTNASGCTDSISKPIVVNAFPTLTLAALSTNANPVTTLSLLPGWTTTITATMSTGPNATYVWQLNGTNINNTTNNYLVNVDKLGEYTVVGTSDLGCTSLAAKITIKDSASTKLFIYPSPNNGKFSIAYYNPGGGTVKQIVSIYSSIGKRIFNAEYSISQPWKNIPIDLRNHGGGVYYVVIRDGNGKRITTGEVLVR